MVEPRGDRRMGETITAEEWLEQSIPVEAGGTLYVNADRGRIDVSSHDANEVRVEAAARGWRAGLVLFSLEKSENDVHFDVSIDAFLPGFLGAAHITARIWVPPRYSVDLESAGGHVRVEDVCGRIDAHSRGGHMTATRLDGPVSLRTSGGHITVETELGVGSTFNVFLPWVAREKIEPLHRKKDVIPATSPGTERRSRSLISVARPTAKGDTTSTLWPPVK